MSVEVWLCLLTMCAGLTCCLLVVMEAGGKYSSRQTLKQLSHFNFTVVKFLLFWGSGSKRTMAAVHVHHSDPMRSIAYTSEDIKWCEASSGNHQFSGGSAVRRSPGGALHTPCETCPLPPPRRSCAESRACVRAAAAKAAAAAPQNDPKEGSR